MQTYTDAALSGATRFRPDYQKLVHDAEERVFDIVLVEALDRLGRKLADIAAMHERLSFLGITLVRRAEKAHASSPLSVALHPNLPAVYRRKVEQLEAVLEGEERTEALALIRSMIEAVVLTPRGGQGTGLDALLYGDLAAILVACAEAGPKRQQPASWEAGCQLSVVAGAGFGLYRTHIQRWALKPQR